MVEDGLAPVVAAYLEAQLLEVARAVEPEEEVARAAVAQSVAPVPRLEKVRAIMLLRETDCAAEGVADKLPILQTPRLVVPLLAGPPGRGVLLVVVRHDGGETARVIRREQEG